MAMGYFYFAGSAIHPIQFASPWIRDFLLRYQAKYRLWTIACDGYAKYHVRFLILKNHDKEKFHEAPETATQVDAEAHQ